MKIFLKFSLFAVLLAACTIRSLYSESLFRLDFENPSSWDVVGESISLSSSKGYEGNALKINYEIKGDSQWVVAAKSFENPVPLAKGYIVTLFIKGEAPENNFEFKFFDDKGNVYWKKFENFQPDSKWQKVNIESTELVFAWGPGPDAGLTSFNRIELGISKGLGGKGTIEIDELTITEADVSPLPKKSALGVKSIKASESQDERFSEKFAVDGNMRTRWSSHFKDPQWLEIELEQEKELAGLIIYWEAAFGSSYDISLSLDGKKWDKVFSTEKGDGNSDEIYFAKQKAKFVKILGKKRGTSWGYSIYEIRLLDSALSPEIASSNNSKESHKVLDGDTDSAWLSNSKKVELLLDFKQNRDFGGFIILWNGTPPGKRYIYVSDDKSNWKRVYNTERTIISDEYIYFSNAKGRFVRINAESASSNIGINEIYVKGSDEKLNKQRGYEITALMSPEGYYPMWLSRKQEYWTIVGVADDDQESLVSETGIIEPWHYSHTLSPALKINGKVISYNDIKITQVLEDKYLPIPVVTWQKEGITLDIKVFASGSPQKSSTYAEYTITNTGKKSVEGEFFLMVRPFQLNPPWMHGGLSDIKSIEYDMNRKNSMLSVNGREVLFVPVKPDTYLTCKKEEFYGDVIEQIIVSKAKKGLLSISDSEGTASSALGYSFNIEPGQKKSYRFAVPLHDKVNEINKSGFNDFFDAEYIKVRKFWKDKLSVVKIELPDREFTDTLKSNIVYILLNDDRNRLQPGSRNYEASWMRDGAVTATALLSMGYPKEVRRYMDWMSGFVQEDGWVPFIIGRNDEIVTHGWKEFDSQGQYIYSILQYYLFKRDASFLKDKKDKITKTINFIKARRAERLTEEYKDESKLEFYGIFPESASHEGYIDPPRHSYWDDFWGIRGLNDAVRIYEILGEKQKAKWADKERKGLQDSTYKSIEIVARKKNINYIPGCAELGDPDPTSTAIALWPCNEMKNMPEKLMLATFEMYWKELNKRINGDWTNGFTPYELRNANAFMMTGQRDKLHSMLTKFFEWKRPRAWHHWAEVVTPDYRLAQYLGDMPHTWIGAGFVNVVRNLLIFEDVGVLYLAKGVGKEWVASGKRIAVTDMPTHFGNVSYEVVSTPSQIKVKVSGSLSKFEDIVFVTPPDNSIKEVFLNGEKYDINGKEGVHFKNLPVEILFKK